jgi:hypothetical protein
MARASEEAAPRRQVVNDLVAPQPGPLPLSGSVASSNEHASTPAAGLAVAHLVAHEHGAAGSRSARGSPRSASACGTSTCRRDGGADVDTVELDVPPSRVLGEERLGDDASRDRSLVVGARTTPGARPRMLRSPRGRTPAGAEALSITVPSRSTISPGRATWGPSSTKENSPARAHGLELSHHVTERSKGTMRSRKPPPPAPSSAAGDSRLRASR